MSSGQPDSSRVVPFESAAEDPVQQQYERYPYPARDPREESKRLITGSPSNLAEINHYLFAGRRDFARPFRALVAGGGTGDATIMLAQQLADYGRGGEVVYLDSSVAARKIAEGRARARGLSNITFVTADLQTLPDLQAGLFDYIDCCGVLHHLEDPPVGLAALVSVLADTGGIGLMVYGEYGRTGLYGLQDMLRRMRSGRPLEEHIPLARRVIEALPKSNWFRRNPFLGDHKRSDAELVDLCLHARDRAYTVPELVDLVGDAGLAITSFVEPLRYAPGSYLSDPIIMRQVETLPWIDQAAIAEVLAGNMKKHIVYLVKQSAIQDGTLTHHVACPDQPDAVPVLRDLSGPRLAHAVQRDLKLTAEFDGLHPSYPLPPLAPAILLRINDQANLADIYNAILDFDETLEWDKFKEQFDQLYAVLNGLNRLLIAYPAASGR